MASTLIHSGSQHCQRPLQLHICPFAVGDSALSHSRHSSQAPGHDTFPAHLVGGSSVKAQRLMCAHTARHGCSSRTSSSKMPKGRAQTVCTLSPQTPTATPYSSPARPAATQQIAKLRAAEWEECRRPKCLRLGEGTRNRSTV